MRLSRVSAEPHLPFTPPLGYHMRHGPLNQVPCAFYGSFDGENSQNHALLS